MKQLAIISFFVCCAAALIIYFWQRNLIYFPAKEMPSRQVFHAADMQQVSLRTRDKLLLNSWYKAAAENKPTLLYLHGNAGHIGHRMFLVRQFLAAGYGVLLLEYRGYGGNPGKPYEQGLYMDGRAAMQFLQTQGVEAKELVIYGESLGTGVATQMASEFPSCALILQSPYTSLTAVARYHYPWIVVSPWDKYDSLARIEQINSPLLILHGTDDRIVPYTLGLALFNQAKEPKQLINLAGKGHNDLWDKTFAKQVINFIDSYCP